MTDKHRLVAFGLHLGQYTHLDARNSPLLAYGVVWPTVDAAIMAVDEILTEQRHRFEAGLATRGPEPAAAKKAWDDKVGAFAVVEERVATWEHQWTREPQRGSTALATVRVLIRLERRVAWRPVRQVTRTTEAGLEVVHELGEPGPWSEWHPDPAGSRTYVPTLEISITPHALTMCGSPSDVRAWVNRELNKSSEEVQER